jgi:hypothetical protein
MPNQVGMRDAKRVDQPKLVDDHILHANQVRRGIAFAETGVKRQIDAKTFR